MFRPFWCWSKVSTLSLPFLQPCRRCTRENKECVLGESHRGGRRIRKKARVDGGSMSSRASSTQDTTLQPPEQPDIYSPISQSLQLPVPNPYQPIYENRIDGFNWQQPRPDSSSSDSRNLLKHTLDTSVSELASWLCVTDRRNRCQVRRMAINLVRGESLYWAFSIPPSLVEDPQSNMAWLLPIYKTLLTRWRF